MKKMLIDATHSEETRVVILDNQRVDDFESETQGKQQHKGNIYVGHVSRVEPSLQAAFITYGGNRNGFLAFAECHPQYFALKAGEKAELLEEMAEQAARRRGEDEAEDSPEATPTPRAPRAERNFQGQARGGRARPQRVGEDTPTAPTPAPAAQEVTSRAAPEGPTENPNYPEPTFYEDPEDAAAAKKAAAMMDKLAATEHGVEGNTLAAPKATKGGRGRPQRGAGHAGGGRGKGKAEGGHAGAGQGQGGGKRRPTRMNARRPQRQVEATAQGVTETAAEDILIAALPIEMAPNMAVDMAVHVGTAETAAGTPTPEAPQARAPREDKKPSGPIHRRYRIQDVLKEGQKILVQVVKEERGSKGAALTTYFSLPGRYTVLMPNTPSAGGISRKITDSTERNQLRETYRALEVPATMGLIIRTAGTGQEMGAIKADYANLQQLWAHITQKFEAENDIQCLHEDGSIIVRALRDMANDEVDEIVIAGQRAYKAAKEFAKAFMPETLKKISLYKEEAPIFSHHKVEQKLLQLHHARVQLPSGGSLVINPTEALVAIDINSGRNTHERNIEETATKTNLEACEEIARQIRLRDLAGLIVVDFIDMENYGNTRKVEQAMRRALKRDRARIQTGSISEFGLMEISRQRLRPSFAENHTVSCPHCNGSGLVMSASSAGLMLLRRLEEEDAAAADRITAAAATPTVLWVLNHKRELIRSLEEKYKYLLHFKADDSLLAPDASLELTRMKADGTEVVTQVNVELREQAEVPPEKRYTKEGRAQRQKEDDAREELKREIKTEKPTEKSTTTPPTKGKPQGRGAKPERPARPAPSTTATAVAVEANPAKQAEAKPAPKANKPKATKLVVEAKDTPLAVQQVKADDSADPVIMPSKPKAKFALKQQADTDRDLAPVAVAKISGDATPDAPKPAKPKKADKSLLSRFLGV